jgi:hypothetical protein
MPLLANGQGSTIFYAAMYVDAFAPIKFVSFSKYRVKFAGKYTFMYRFAQCLIKTNRPNE